jgi:hypothetical protein
MWNVDPMALCNQHLIGEHFEMHMFSGAIRKGTSLKGFIETGLVEIDKIIVRHNDLAHEMERRQMKHRSPLPPWEDFSLLRLGKVDVENSLMELSRRCPTCRENIKIVYGEDYATKEKTENQNSA